ncbi:MAG: exostosin family protein [Phycisphaerae bacterium]
MAIVHLRTAAFSLAEPTRGQLHPIELLTASATLAAEAAIGQGRQPEHVLCDDPAEADVILFAESHNNDSGCGLFQEHVRRDCIYNRYAEKCYIHCGLDHFPAFLPGIYPSIPASRHDPRWTRGGGYLMPRTAYLTDYLERTPEPKRHLASFIGSFGSHPVRQLLAPLHDGEDIFVEDRQKPYLQAHNAGNHAEVDRLKRDYIEVGWRSHFMLCPRGIGPASLRPFDAMQLGIAPVVISDEWVRPEGPDWDRFSLQIPENRIKDLPAILAERRADATEMGRIAQQQFDRFYARHSIFQTVMQGVLAIHADRLPLAVGRRRAWLSLTRGDLRRGYFRHLRHKLAG